MELDVIEIPGTARIRKICDDKTPMELLLLCVKLAIEGYDKKLWSVLSRVYEEGKTFEWQLEDGMEECIKAIMDADIMSEYKLQTFTSFQIPESLLPSIDTCRELIHSCSPKRGNIAGYFIAEYSLCADFYKETLSDKTIFQAMLKQSLEKDLYAMYEAIFLNESKEVITGAIRLIDECKYVWKHSCDEMLSHLTEVAFSSKEVFFTSKLMFCMYFDVPRNMLPENREIYKILKISINYEERITKEFVRIYGFDFDCSDEALCRYYIGNKKATKEKVLVTKFANHLVRIDDEQTKKKLLRGAFKRGGYFRMYAGCMQDGKIIAEKMQRFHYSDEDVTWCAKLPGLK